MPNLLPFLTYIFITAFTPGPNNVMAMANANRHGFRKTLRFVLGVFVGFSVIMLLCACFNVVLFDLLPKAKPVMTALGALYLLFLAVKISLPRKKAAGREKGDLNTFSAGLLLQFVNAKIVLYGITALSAFVLPHYRAAAPLILFSFLLAFVGVLGNLAWAAFGALFQKLLTTHERAFHLAMGALLVYSAASIALPLISPA